MNTDGATGARPEPEQGQGGATGGTTVNIGSMSGGSLATGEHGTAQSTNITVSGPDAEHQRLLTAVRELRGRLRKQERTAEDSALDAELAEVETEIGQGGRGRLARLLGRLATYGPAAATAASVAAVVQAIAQVLG